MLSQRLREDLLPLVFFLLTLALALWRVERELAYLWEEELGEGYMHVRIEGIPQIEDNRLKTTVLIKGGDFPELYDKKAHLTLYGAEDIPSREFILRAKAKVFEGRVFLSASYKDIEKPVPVESFRDHLMQKAQEKIKDPEVEALVLTYFFGEAQDLLPSDLQYAFRQTGLVHLLVISGSHIALVFLLLRYMLPYPYGLYLAFAGVSLYALFAVPPEPPVLRAYLMLFLWLLVKLFEGRANPLGITLYSGSLLLLYKPEFLTSYSFWLSLFATLYIVLSLENFKKEGSYLYQNLFLPFWTSLFAFLGVSPLILTFSNTSAGSIVFTPLMAPLLFPFTLFGLLELTTFFSLPAFPLEITGRLLTGFVSFLSNFDLQVNKGFDLMPAVAVLLMNALLLYFLKGYYKLFTLLVFLVWLVVAGI